MTEDPHTRFDQLLKAMVQSETPKASNERQEEQADARTFRHKRPVKDQ